MIEQFEQAEIKKDEEAERVRLKNINLKMTVKKLENNLRAKEQLAEGLHLIDFEQLKIENQTLNEKIEERNEELHKLRKKNTTTVQVRGREGGGGRGQGALKRGASTTRVTRLTPPHTRARPPARRF